MRNKVFQRLLFLCFIILSYTSYAQAPAQFNFQGAARDIDGSPMVAKKIALRFSIRTGTANGTIEYQESRSVLTDSNGVFNAVIGGAEATNIRGNLMTVLWGSGAKFLQVEMDHKDGTAFINLGTTQLLSVPYALMSQNSLNSNYAASSGNYFFEVTFPVGLTRLKKDAFETLIFPRSNYNHVIKRTAIDSAGNIHHLLDRSVYDTTTGEFTAPETGIYQFDFKAHTYSLEPSEENDWRRAEVDFLLFKNGKIIMEMTDTYYNSQGVRLLLEAGDIIKIMYDSNNVCCTGIRSGYEDEPEYDALRMNYFSGYKIK